MNRYHPASHVAIWIPLLIVCCRSGDAPHGQSRHLPVRPGTYALLVCRGPCDASHRSNVIRSGWAVLDAVPIDMRALPDSVALDLKPDVITLKGKANGCWRLDEDRPEVKTYAGRMGAGLLLWSWTDRGDSIAFDLYRSPDAGHSVTAVPTATGLAGRGRSWGVGMAAVDFPDDIVVGEYTGPPNPRLCREAGLAALRRSRELEKAWQALPPATSRSRPSA